VICSEFRRAGSALAVLALVLVTPFAQAADEPVVRFLQPRHNATAIGATTITLFIDHPPEATVERLDVSADGRLLDSLTSPPWTLEWNAGDGSRGHRLEAVLFLKDGRSARARVTTSRLLVNQIEQVDLVNLYLVVRDGGGKYVSDLTSDDFRIFESRNAQTIERFSTSHKPLRVGIVLDTSLSMEKEDRLDKAKKAALQFLDVLLPGDEGLVVTFSDNVRVAQALTADKTLLAEAVEGANAGGGTALYDSVWRTARKLEDFDGRRVLVVLSDGRDEASNGFEPGSLHTLEEALDQALRSEVMVFPIGLGSNLDRQYVRRWGPLDGRSNLDPDQTLLDVLEHLAASTGGRAVIAKSAGNLRKAFTEIANDLRNQYSIAYVSTDEKRNGKWRRIDVETPGRVLEVVTRKGYYAKPADGR